MIKFVLFVLFVLCSCQKNKAHIMSPGERVMLKSGVYKTLWTDDMYPERCDKLTFKALYSAYGVEQNLKFYEIEPGKLVRDAENPCYVEGESGHGSESSISFDPYLMSIHDALNRKDLDYLFRVKSYGINHKWTMGEGIPERVFMPHLKYFLDKAIKKLDGSFKLDDSLDALPNYFGGFRAHLGALAVDLVGRCDGSIGDIYLSYLKKLHDENQGSFLIQKIYHKWSDGNFDEVIAILNDDVRFPTDRLPDIEMDELDWGSAPIPVIFIVTTNI